MPVKRSVAKITSLVVKVGALAFILFLPTQYALDLQLLGGLWIVQTLPALVFGLFTVWFRAEGLLLGWAVGIGWGTLHGVEQRAEAACHASRSAMPPTPSMSASARCCSTSWCAVIATVVVEHDLTRQARRGGLSRRLLSDGAEVKCAESRATSALVFSIAASFTGP